MPSYFHIDRDIALAPLQLADAQEIFNLVAQHRAHLAAFLYWVPQVIDVPTAAEYIRQRIASGLPNARWFKVQYLGRSCGVFAVKSIDPASHTAELGYWLSPDQQGLGIIGRVIARLPQLFAQQLPDCQVRALAWHCLEQNAASIRIAEKAGGICVDRLPDHSAPNGQSQDLLIYQAPLKPVATACATETQAT